MIAIAMLLVGCDYRYNMDDMEVVAKKDLGSDMVEYTIQTKGDRNDSFHINLSSKDNSFQIHDRIKITSKDN